MPQPEVCLDPDASTIISLDELDRRRVWRECLSLLRSRVADVAYNTWLARTALLDVTGGRVVVAVPSEIAREWIVSRHLGEIGAAVEQITGRRSLSVVAEVVESLSVDEEDEDAATIVEVEVRRPPREDHVAHGRGRIENNLSRKAIFTLQGKRGGDIGTTTVTDVVGKVTRQYTLGQLGALEMDICVWLLGQWSPRNEGRISFSLRELARGLGVSWNGDFGAEAKKAVRRMKAMTITGRVFDAGTRRYKEHGFSLIDEYVLDEERESIDVEGTKASGRITIQVGDWVVRQLEAGQYADLELGVYRSPAMRKPKARRLYQYLECEEGEMDGTFLRIAIDDHLAETMGTSDFRTNPSRFRRDLLSYGQAICEATGGAYASFEMRAGLGRNAYELHVHRHPAWRHARGELRRSFNAQYRQELLRLGEPTGHPQRSAAAASASWGS